MDIAILLGKQRTSITRTLIKLERSEEWRARLIPMSRYVKATNGDSIYAYTQEIFDLLIDHYEEEYLQRFLTPRRCRPDKMPDEISVRKFWQYLKASDENEERFYFNHQAHGYSNSLQGTVSSRWADVFSLFWNRAFDIRVLTVVPVIFSLCLSISQQWLSTAFAFMVIPLIVLLASAFMMRSQKFPADILVNTGALLFSLLWCSRTSGGLMHVL